MSAVQMTSELKADGDADFLPAGAVAAWAGGLPADARITAVTGTGGHQRDPYTVMRSLRATWTEQRPDLPGGATATYGQVVRP